MKIIFMCVFFVLLLFGGSFALWKFDEWVRPLTTGEIIVLKNYNREDMFNKIRNRMIIPSLVFIWIFTLASGTLGIWKHITAPLLIAISATFTICCIICMIKKCYCNICLGICMIYQGYLCLLAAYKIGCFQFAISFWWLLGAFTLNTIISLLALWRFVKKGKKIQKTSKNKAISFSALGIALVTYPIISAFGRFMKQNNVGNDVAVPIIMVCLLLFSLESPFGACYLVLDDSKMLRQFEFKEK